MEQGKTDGKHKDGKGMSERNNGGIDLPHLTQGLSKGSGVY